MGRRKSRKPIAKVTHHSEKGILSNEDWHPTTDGKLSVSLIGWDTGEWKVCVWGGDDFGLERYYKDQAPAQQEFDRIVNLTTKADLRARGFEPG